MKKSLKDLTKIAGPPLTEIVPDFKVPDFQSDEEEVAWLDANHERLAELVRKHGVNVKLALKES